MGELEVQVAPSLLLRFQYREGVYVCVCGGGGDAVYIGMCVRVPVWFCVRA